MDLRWVGCICICLSDPYVSDSLNHVWSVFILWKRKENLDLACLRVMAFERRIILGCIHNRSRPRAPHQVFSETMFRAFFCSFAPPLSFFVGVSAANYKANDCRSQCKRTIFIMVDSSIVTYIMRMAYISTGIVLPFIVKYNVSKRSLSVDQSVANYLAGEWYWGSRESRKWCGIRMQAANFSWRMVMDETFLLRSLWNCEGCAGRQAWAWRSEVPSISRMGTDLLCWQGLSLLEVRDGVQCGQETIQQHGSPWECPFQWF